MDRWLRGAFGALLVLGMAAPSSQGRADDVWETPSPGVMYLRRTTSNPWDIHAALIDLCAPGVRVRATRSDERTRVVSAWAEEVGAAVAINGDFFSWESGYKTSGLSMGDGERWVDTADDDTWALIAFGEMRAEIFAEALVVNPPETWMRETLGGVPLVVQDGAAITSYPGWSFCSARHPRTAVGITEDRRTLILVAVDGRSDQSVGMTCPELGDLMESLGSHVAVNLDGGGSTTLYMQGRGVVNRPSGGSERVVANHLGVVLDGTTGVNACPAGGGTETPPGGFPRCAADAGRPGATVEVDDSDACFSTMGPSIFDGPDHVYTYAVDCGGARGPRACDQSDTSGRWTFHVEQAGAYRFEAHIPAASPTEHALSARAPYRIAHLDGETSSVVDQESGRGTWVALGELALGVQNNVFVELHDNTGEPYARGSASNRVVTFDAVRMVGAASNDGGPSAGPDAGTAPDAGLVDGGAPMSRPGPIEGCRAATGPRESGSGLLLVWAAVTGLLIRRRRFS